MELNDTRSVFSETSLDYNVDFLTKDKMRILNNDDLLISFTVRLKLNEESFKQNDTISDTACVQYMFHNIYEL